MRTARLTRILPLLLAAAASAAPENADALLKEALKPPPAQREEQRGAYFTTHALLGTVALTTFSAALVVSAASGNLGKLMDPQDCCPDGGNRAEPYRTIDRALVRTGIAAYMAAGGMALFNLTVRDKDAPREKHNAHRWLAVAHASLFATSMVTGIMMAGSQDSDPDKFAQAARVHTASNVLFVPVLAVSFSNILFED